MTQVVHHYGVYARGSNPSDADIKAGAGTGYVSGSYYTETVEQGVQVGSTITGLSSGDWDLEGVTQTAAPGDGYSTRATTQPFSIEATSTTVITYYGVWNRDYLPTDAEVKAGTNAVAGTYATIESDIDVQFGATINNLSVGDYDLEMYSESGVDIVRANRALFSVPMPNVAPDWGTGIPDRNALDSNGDTYHVWSYLNNDVHPAPTYSIVGGPAGFTIPNGNVGTVERAAGILGDHVVPVTATNSQGNDETSFTWTQTAGLSFTAGPTIVSNAGGIVDASATVDS